MGNVNIQIPDELHKKAKVYCAVEEITLKDFIIKLLDEKLKKK
ncbi:hypothetical protein ACFLZX_05435 [Nanoarchaeota archaeon]